MKILFIAITVLSLAISTAYAGGGCGSWGYASGCGGGYASGCGGGYGYSRNYGTCEGWTYDYDATYGCYDAMNYCQPVQPCQPCQPCQPIEARQPQAEPAKQPLPGGSTPPIETKQPAISQPKVLEPPKQPLPGPTTYYIPTPEPEPSLNGTIIVHVPVNASVKINGKATQSTGIVRTYVSQGLERGKSYRYDVTVDGKTKRVMLSAGDSRELNFLPAVILSAW